MKTKTKQSPVPAITGALVLAALIGWIATTQPAKAARQQESEVNPNAQSVTADALIPPIDTKAPALVKTASFGLG